MSSVTLTIDGREVTVPAGIGLVEAAAELGVEIPVFCYEPRIGPPVGACRMCLVEIEGVPKLQAACATGVRPGMVVSTQSARAREAQEAVLEFLLVNHPLDCPVCDKGGECPLQDHAFRWGPGASRFQELKRVNDKPIPVSPLIALDRERCILCYRCTRFSEEVSEDLQLVARQRGANSVIATFEGRPWEGTHSGNVIELCPVGALTSTQYRFRARPWEAPDHPSIAGWDPVGSNTYNTVREDEVVRVISRRNDAVDVGWIDDRTRFAYTSMYGPSRIRLPQLRSSEVLVDASMEVALEWLHDRIAAPAASDVAARDAAQEADESEPAASPRELWVLSGTETLETAFSIQQLAALTGGRVVAVPGASAAAPASSATIADLGAARHVLVVGDTDLLDDAPALDLWVRTARKNGASVTAAGIGGTRLEQAGAHLEHVAPGGLDAWAIGFADRIAKVAGSSGAMEEPGVIVYRDGELSDAALERLATTFSFPRAGSGFLAIPSAPNARGLAALDIEAAASWDEILRHDGGVIYVGVDPLRFVTEAAWKGAAATWTAAIDTLPSALHATADLVIPGAWTGEQDGTLVNLEGRLQRLTVGVEPP
ncbi:MAG: NADH-quinone oxidoreductase, chain, partial [Thermoleophilia bacterium]|nr:NADH-quinone oxidoreductase, chain [Thermoleophilia bacterium]